MPFRLMRLGGENVRVPAMRRAALLSALLSALPCAAGAQALQGLGEAGADPDSVDGVADAFVRLGERVEADRVRRRRPRKPRLPREALLAPLLEQTTSYACGPAALLSVLRYWDVFKGSETALHEPLDTHPDHGTEPEKLVEVAKKYGLEATQKTETSLDDLRAGLGRGELVILDIQAWRWGDDLKTPWKDTWERGHYVVLVGMDERYAYVSDPLTPEGYCYLPLKELLERWHDYEDRRGPRVEHRNLAIFIKGRKDPVPAQRPRGRPIRIE